MPRSLFVIVLSLVLLITPMSARRAAAQDGGNQPAHAYSYWCTVADAALRTCPQWRDCDVRLTYAPDTLLPVVETVTGDRDFGSDRWLVVEDPVQGIQGYIHSARARQCTPQP